jgi:hypothetical protein
LGFLVSVVVNLTLEFVMVSSFLQLQEKRINEIRKREIIDFWGMDLIVCFDYQKYILTII